MHENHLLNGGSNSNEYSESFRLLDESDPAPNPRDNGIPFVISLHNLNFIKIGL